MFPFRIARVWRANARRGKTVALPATPLATSERLAFDPLETFAGAFKLVGAIPLDRCPVCESPSIARLWQFPQTRLDRATTLKSPGSRFDGFYLDYLPMLTVPQEIFAFDICRDCHSVFRNPKDDDHRQYLDDASKVAAYRAAGLEPFRGQARRYEGMFPRGAKFVVDAACGGGQVLAAFRERNPNLKLLGLDLSKPSVDFINSLGIPARQCDLDLDDLDAVAPPGSVDFIVFYEAFEHVRQPLKVLKKLVRALRPGGRLHFTAQYYGPQNQLQIRVGEPIYIDRDGLDWVLSQLDVRLYDLVVNIKFRVTIEKQ